MRIITLFLVLIIALSHHDREYEHDQYQRNQNDQVNQDNTNRKYNRDTYNQDLQNVKGFHYHEDLTNDSFWNPDAFRNIWDKLGFANKESVSSGDFRQALYHLTGYDDPMNIPVGVKDIFDRYLNNLPDNINNTDINKYFNVDKFFNNIKDYYNEKNQPTYYQQLMDTFKKGWRNISDVFKYIVSNNPSAQGDHNSFCCSEQELNNILNNLNLKDKQNLNKNDIERIVKRLFSETDNQNVPQCVTNIFNKIMENIPDQMTLNQLKDKLSYGNVMPIVKKIAKDTCGEECFDKFKDDWDRGDLKQILSHVFNYTCSRPEDL